MFKKVILMFACMLFMLICNINNIFAAENNKDSISLYVNDENFELVDGLINIDGYTYISVNDAKWLFGYNYNFDVDNSKVTLNYYEDINNNVSTEGNKMIAIDFFIGDANLGEAYLYNNTIYVPLRKMANRNYCDIKWDAINCIIKINYNVGNIFGKEIIKSVEYSGSLGFEYVFIIYNDKLYDTKSILMLECGGTTERNFKNINEYLKSIKINYVLNRKFVDLDEDEYLSLMEKIDNLLNDKYKGNADGIDSTGQSDFICRIVNKNDNYETIFESRPMFDTTKEYKDLREYLKSLSGYEMKFITPY